MLDHNPAGEREGAILPDMPADSSAPPDPPEIEEMASPASTGRRYADADARVRHILTRLSAARTAGLADADAGDIAWLLAERDRLTAEVDAARAETAAQFEAMHWAASLRALDEAAPLTDDERARLPTAEALFPHAAAFLAEVAALRERVAALTAAITYQRDNLATLSRALWSHGHYHLSAEGIDKLVERIDIVLGGAADGAAGGGTP